MNLFGFTKKVIASYQTEVSKLEEQEMQLQQKLEDLQLEHTACLADQQSISDIGELVYLNKQARDIVDESKIIESLLERVNDDKSELKVKYVSLINEAKSKDYSLNSKHFDGNQVVNKYRYLMLSEIAEKGKVMSKQYYEIAPSIQELFEDSRVQETFTKAQLRFEVPKVTYFEAFNTVVSKQDVLLACGGHIRNGVPVPKDVKEDE